jgi:ferredoxin
VSTLADPGLLTDLAKFGAVDVSACFSCGTCTATCPLVDVDASFPRRMIRYAEIGLTDDLLGSKELWTCYQCGLCSDSCPTGADPAQFMATARRYAVAGYDRTGLARILSTRPLAGSVVAFALAAFFALFLYATHGPQDTERLSLFTFVPAEAVHWTGIAVMAALAVAGVSGAVTMARRVGRREGVAMASLVRTAAARRATVAALWSALGVESLGQRRFRQDCHDDGPPAEPPYRRRWLVHALSIWGFLGLLAATALDWGLDLTGVKPTGTSVALWYPTRLLGTLAGVSLVYGVTMFAVARWRHEGRAAAVSTPGDWLLLALLWLTGVTGFVIEVALYLPDAPAWGYWVFLVHVAVAMELMLLLPFTKFAHAIYRPLALFFHARHRGRTMPRS